MDRRQVGVLKQRHQIRLGRLLQRHDRAALEAQVRLEVLCDLAHEPLEGQLADEQLRRLLVPPDLAQGDRARAEAVGLLHAAGCGLDERKCQRQCKWEREGKRRTAAVLRAWDLAASCLRGALPPVDLRAVCFVRAIVCDVGCEVVGWW